MCGSDLKPGTCSVTATGCFYLYLITMNEQTICTTCGTEFPTGMELPALCPVCDDDRQYIGEGGQQWTSLEALSNGYSVLFKKIQEQLYDLRMIPSFAIGQRAFLILTPEGNILWDCIPLINEPVAEFIRSKGGLKAIVFSHPHYYSTMNQWAEAFDCPVYIHEADEPWVKNKGPRIQWWAGREKAFWNGIKAIHTGGHFPGSAVLQAPAFSPGGVLFCGDSLYLARSKQYIAVMHSYPNHVPLTRQVFAGLLERVQDLQFDTVYGAFDWQVLAGNAREVFLASMDRYRNVYGL